MSTWFCREASGDADGFVIGDDADDRTAGILLRGVLVANYTSLHRSLLRHLGCECLHDAWVRLGNLHAFTSLHSPQAHVHHTACNLATDRLRCNRPWHFTGDADTELKPS